MQNIIHEIPQCTICMEDLLGDLIATQCGHVFHVHWIRHAMQVKPNWPTCRSKLTPKKLLNLNYGINVRVAGSPSKIDKDEAVAKVIELTQTLNRQNEEYMCLKIRHQNTLTSNENKQTQLKKELQAELNYYVASNESLTQQLTSLQQIWTNQGQALESANGRLEVLETLSAIMESIEKSSSLRDCQVHIDQLPLKEQIKQYKSTLLLADQKQQRLNSENDAKKDRINDLKKQLSEIKYMYSKVNDKNLGLLKKLSQMETKPSLKETEVIDNIKQENEDSETQKEEQKPTKLGHQSTYIQKSKTSHSLLNRNMVKSITPITMSRSKPSVTSKITKYF